MQAIVFTAVTQVSSIRFVSSADSESRLGSRPLASKPCCHPFSEPIALERELQTCSTDQRGGTAMTGRSPRSGANVGEAAAKLATWRNHGVARQRRKSALAISIKAARSNGTADTRSGRPCFTRRERHTTLAVAKHSPGERPTPHRGTRPAAVASACCLCWASLRSAPTYQAGSWADIRLHRAEARRMAALVTQPPHRACCLVGLRCAQRRRTKAGRLGSRRRGIESVPRGPKKQSPFPGIAFVSCENQ